MAKQKGSKAKQTTATGPKPTEAEAKAQAAVTAPEGTEAPKAQEKKKAPNPRTGAPTAEGFIRKAHAQGGAEKGTVRMWCTGCKEDFIIKESDLKTTESCPKGLHKTQPVVEKAPKAPKAEKGSPEAPQTKVGPAVNIKKMKNQDGAPEGDVRYWCNACAAAFNVVGTAEPEACPAGHAAKIHVETTGAEDGNA